MAGAPDCFHYTDIKWIWQEKAPVEGDGQRYRKSKKGKKSQPDGPQKTVQLTFLLI